MKNNNPVISIIVPVYKVELYLHKCIDSILEQSFTDFELLLIDDGSPDKCGKICDEYAVKDKRIKVYHKKNGGPSSARNYGLDNAKGEWIVFIDSDDYVGKDYLRCLYEMVESDIDLVVQPLLNIEENGELIYNDQITDKTIKIYSRKDFKQMLSEQHLILRAYPTSKLFRRSFFVEDNSLRFYEDVRFCEDYIFLFCYLNLNWNKICFSPVSNYYYVNRRDSIVHGKNSFDEEFLVYKYANKVVKPFIDRKDCDIEDLNNTYFMHRALTMVKYVSDLKKISSEDWMHFCRYFKGSTKKTILDKYMIKTFYSCPVILFLYLYIIRTFREFLEKRNLWTIINYFRK